MSLIYYSLFTIYYSRVSAPVAQLDRASDFGSEGRRFEPCRVHQNPPFEDHRWRQPIVSKGFVVA